MLRSFCGPHAGHKNCKKGFPPSRREGGQGGWAILAKKKFFEVLPYLEPSRDRGEKPHFITSPLPCTAAGGRSGGRGRGWGWHF